MKKVAILGSTGSIGTQALDVIRANRDRFKVTSLTCGKNIEELSKQIEEFSPRLVVTADETDALILAKRYPKLEVMYGESGLIAAAEDDSEILLNSLMGMRGLVPTYRGIRSGKDIALANKETLVAGGELVMDAVHKSGVKLLPVDSEHSAIFSVCMEIRVRGLKEFCSPLPADPFEDITESS